jgi:hypothetical protein
VRASSTTGLRPEEEWARRIIEAAVGVPVVQHDDNSREGMHDLEIRYPDAPPAAVEVTAAADGDTIALWNLMNGNGRWIEPEIDGGWLVTLKPAARAKRIRKELPALLGELEGLQVNELVHPSDRGGELQRRAADLQITHAHHSGTDFPGSIYITVDLDSERSGGMVPTTGEPVVAWAVDFLAHDDRSDVLRKLARSGAAERHAFLILPGFSTAPFAVADLLMRDDAPVPVEAPDLPHEVTDVWLVSTWSSGHALHWSARKGWQMAAKPAERARNPQRTGG